MSASLTMTPEQMGKWFDKLQEALTADIPLDGYFDRVELAFKTAAMNCFDQGVDPWGNPWAPVKFRVRDAGGTLQPLRDRGLLMASMTADNASGAIRERGATFIRYGTNLIYAAAHQFGIKQVPKQANYLCMPMTLEALRAGSPKNFPRPLTPRIAKDKDSGVLVEELVGGQPQYGPVKQPKPPPTTMPKMKPIVPAKPAAPEKPKQPDKPADANNPKPQTNDDEVVQYIMVKEATIPARPFLGYSDKLADKMVLILDDWLHRPDGHIGKHFTAA